METQSFREKFEVPKIPVRIFQVQLAMSTILQTEGSKLLENPEKTQFWGPDVGPRLASEKLKRMVGSKRRDSESSTDIDRQNRRLRHEIVNGVRSLGAPTHRRVTVFTHCR